MRGRAGLPSRHAGSRLDPRRVGPDSGVLLGRARQYKDKRYHHAPPCSRALSNRGEALREAMWLGYTETDPRADLSGLDVARKGIVLGRTAGYNVGIEDVIRKPFIPEEYLKKVRL